MHNIATVRPSHQLSASFLLILVWQAATTVVAAQSHTLDNGIVRAEFQDGALVRLSDLASNQVVAFTDDSATLTVSGETFSVPGRRLIDVERRADGITYSYEAGDKRLQVIYELKPAWHFVSKEIRLALPAGGVCRVETVEVLRLETQMPIVSEQKGSSPTGAVFLRLGEGDGQPTSGMFFALQNPFLKWERKDGRLAMAYAPDMEWRADYGPFESDRVCLGVYGLSGIEFPMYGLGEWKYVPDPQRALDERPSLDRAEFEAMARCVEAFVLFCPRKSLRVHVPWCENDYQIDVATTAGRTEWKRILDQCAAVGVEHTLFTPANSAVAPLKDNADAWGWENLLWLGLGQKIRKGEWNIDTDPIPPSIQEMLDYAKSKNVKLMAYVYPTLGWKQNPEWTAWCGSKTSGYVGVDTGVRSFQDWFVDQLVAFQKRTGISGYSFDHWWIAYEPTKEGHQPTSKYAQWYGCRRILEQLRRCAPDVVIDGRQQYQWFGPWTWLGGSYPHPTMNDEQPGSFENFPDLHFSRVSADRQRRAGWYFHVEQFTPWELVPGYMTHQTPRNDPQGRCIRDRAFHVRDWDYLGWRYSVISSIGTAPFNHVVDLLPARDEAEFASFRQEDQQWLRQWMDWTDEHRTTLRRLRPITGPPTIGCIDGTAATCEDRGFVFLFNPNYRAIDAKFVLDETIGLTAGERFVLRELYPRPGRLLGQPGRGPYRRGETVTLPVKGPQAMVLEVVPDNAVELPALLGTTGNARLDGDALILSDVEGAIGTSAAMTVLLPPGKRVNNVRVNGRPWNSFKQADDVLSLDVSFSGTGFEHCQQVGAYDRDFADTVYRAEFTIPQRVFAQLAARREAWPIPYTAEDLLATWRGSHRLLLYVHIADPDDKWDVGLKLNGQPIELKKAYGDVYPLGRERTFTGFYADVSHLKPEVPHAVEIALPAGLQPGRFQGLFFENVEEEFTTEVTENQGVNPTARITVDLGKPGHPVPAGLYGIFMEEINQAFDGGLYAELVRNRSFEEGLLPPGMKLVKKDNGELKMELERLPDGVPREKWEMPWPWSMNCDWDPKRELIGWSLERKAGATGEMALTEANPMNDASSLSLQMKIDTSQSDGAAVSLVNGGYWGINAVKDRSYDLTLYLRPGTFDGTLVATLQSKDGALLGKHDFGPIRPGENWKRLTTKITATGGDPQGRLALVFRGRGELQIDWVSLFPPTWRDRPNGLRPDLAQLLADLKPDFVRYPGGCYTEGLSWQSAPDWRKMVCDPVDRPGMWGYWKYRSTDGFGYHEFLQFCEDIGADAMYVAFCGMTVHPENNWPLEKIGPVIQQTLDAIQYAVGPVDSKWGKVRARMGHPQPFPLKYVEIGNEHPPAVYGDYYVKFREAIKAKYPDIVVVMSMYWSGLNQAAIKRAGDENIDIVDEHAYRPAGWIRNHADYFDKYARKPWKVYVGEYASHSQNGDFNAAMDDSVFLMMMERNGDLVTMASYAPLLCNVNFKNWGVNLIEFDSARSFAHASYYVQKMFNENRADVNLATSQDETPRPDPNAPLFAGGFGLGSWHTHSQFKDLKIYDEEGKLVYRDDFATLDGWQSVRGQWDVKDGVLSQADQGASPSMILLKTPELETGKVTLKARRADGREGFLMFFNTHGIDRYMFCNYGAAGNRHLAIQGSASEGCNIVGGKATDRAIEKDRWYDIRLEVAKDSARMYLDDELVADSRVERLNSLFSQAGYDRQHREVVIKVTNYHGQPVETRIELAGAKRVGKTGRHLLIRSDAPSDQNTLEKPRRIVPSEESLDGCAREFRVVLPPYSINLLRVPAE